VKILHLSDTTLSGNPLQISRLLQKYGGDVGSRHLVWATTSGFRTFETDLVAETMPEEELAYWLHDWADVIHYHDGWKKLKVLRHLGIAPPKKISVIQVHSPRSWIEDLALAFAAKVPIAMTAHLNIEDWPEADFVVPGVLDITDAAYLPLRQRLRSQPTLSHAPSNWAARGWEGESFTVVNPILTALRDAGEIYYQLIVKRPHKEVLALKRHSDIGVDEILGGSCGLSSLEYLALGVPCFADIGERVRAGIKELTGATDLPWLDGSAGSLKRNVGDLVRAKMWQVYGERSRLWMETYWNPQALVAHYLEMYRSL
jgi:hypothetical protein